MLHPEYSTGGIHEFDRYVVDQCYRVMLHTYSWFNMQIATSDLVASFSEYSSQQLCSIKYMGVLDQLS